MAFVLRKGKRFEGGKTYWTITHLKWLKNLELEGLDKETLSEYMITYEYLTDKISDILTESADEPQQPALTTAALPDDKNGKDD